MRLDQLEQYLKQRRSVVEANVAAKIKDPKTIKMLGIAMRHDGTLPKSSIAKLGPKPDDESILALWSTMLDKSLSSTDYGDLSADGKFDEWLTRLYINGAADYEDINGEGGDALGAWKALSTRGKLKPVHQDFNKFKALRQIQQIVRDRDYQSELRKIKDAEVIDKHKREKKEVTLVDNERFLIVMPFNYGACYTFNNSNGYQATSVQDLVRDSLGSNAMLQTVLSYQSLTKKILITKTANGRCTCLPINCRTVIKIAVVT